MQYVVAVIALLYGTLSLIAALSQWKDRAARTAAALMSVGAAAILTAAVLKLLAWGLAWLLLTAGGALICAAAVWNGVRMGKVHYSHHAVRAVLTVLLALGFFFA